MRTIEHTGKFKRDYKRETSGRSREYVRKLEFELAEAVNALAADEVLPARFSDHSLTGRWTDYRDCHIRNDLVLIYRKSGLDVLTLVRLGSHSELMLA